MDKALNYLALAKKGRLAELGEEPVDIKSLFSCTDFSYSFAFFEVLK